MHLLLAFAYVRRVLLLVLLLQVNILYVFQLKHGRGVVGIIIHCREVAYSAGSVVGFLLRTNGFATGPLALRQYFGCFSTKIWTGSLGKKNALQ